MLRLLAFAAIVLAAPLAARDSLGVFDEWGAFRDPGVPRCYAIAMAEPDRRQRNFAPFATVGTWPRREIRGQLHFRLSRRSRDEGPVTLVVGEERFRLTASGAHAWAADPAADAAIVAAMRSATGMSLRATDARGRRFTDRYSLAGAATAMDAATLACARLR